MTGVISNNNQILDAMNIIKTTITVFVDLLWISNICTTVRKHKNILARIQKTGTMVEVLTQSPHSKLINKIVSMN